MSTQIDPLTDRRHAEAWKAVCTEFNLVEEEGGGGENVNEFLCRIAELQIIYGDPTQPVPVGTIRFPTRKG